MENEEDIDTEALQAQIDLSMSFASELVSSWVKKPSVKPSSSSYTKNLEAELRDIMRRPPRLGVGAAIPESSAGSSRDAARLKGRLLGKGNKREREDEEELQRKKVSEMDNDDNEESRGGAIKKKPRLDPFAGPSGLSGKKKGKKPELNGLLASHLTPNRSQRNGAPDAVAGELSDSPDELDTLIPAPVSPEVPQQRKKKKKRKKTGIDGSNDHHTDEPWPGISSVHSSPIISRQEQVEQKSIPSGSPKMPQKVSIPVPLSPSSTRSTTSPVRPHNIPAAFLARPVLNLDGPVEGDGDSEDEKNDSPSTLRKKRRKRRKKKRHSEAAVTN